MTAHFDWRRSMIRVSAWAILVAASCLPSASRVFAANQASPRPAQAAGHPKPAKTFWWEIPKAPVLATNARQRALFALRGAFFDKSIGTPWPLDKPDGEVLTRAPGSFAGPLPQSKIPLYPREIVVEAVFKSWAVYLTPSHRSIYTRIAYEIDRVLEPGPTAWRAGQQIGVLYPGGRVRLSDGRVLPCYWWLPFNRFQRKTYPKPGRQYVLFLQYVPALEGYREHANIEVRHQQVVGGFYGWFAGRIPSGMPLQDFFDRIKNSTKKYESTH